MNITRQPLIQGFLRLRSIVKGSRPIGSLLSVRCRELWRCNHGHLRLLSSAPAQKEPSKPRQFSPVDEHGYQIPIEDSPLYTDEEKAHRKKMGRFYSLLIAGMVGFISSSYVFYSRMLNVEAKSVEDGANTRNEEELVDGDQSKESGKKEEEVALHKSKAGFRERKVRQQFRKMLRWWEEMSSYCLQL